MYIYTHILYTHTHIYIQKLERKEYKHIAKKKTFKAQKETKEERTQKNYKTTRK